LGGGGSVTFKEMATEELNSFICSVNTFVGYLCCCHFGIQHLTLTSFSLLAKDTSF